MKIFKVLLGLATLVAIGFGITQSEAAHNGSNYATQHRPIVFARLQSADTLTSVYIPVDLHKEITYIIKIESRHASGAMSSDTVYCRLAISLDDTNYVNASDTNEIKKYITEDNNSITFDRLGSYPYNRLEFDRMTDSLNVYVKAFISTRENSR
jgi:hypothetical protein